ncbi:hypothetical protein G6F56_012406 [Rhizopus delemar]|nr:hypothetical protein G6F56_012406 [Rhizopus delemar]
MNLNLFKQKPKTPQDLVKHLKDAIQRIDGSDKRKAAEDVSRYLVMIKNILYGEDDHDPNPDLVAQLSQEVYKTNLLQLMILNIQKFEFEAKKDVAQIFNNLLKRHIGSRFPTVEYLSTHEDILFYLLKGYEQTEIALNCGSILRECVRHEALAKTILYSKQFYCLFEYIEMSTFDVASDAFASFKETLAKHKQMVAEFLETNYDNFFEHYQKLLQSGNYVTKRQSLKV